MTILPLCCSILKSSLLAYVLCRLYLNARDDAGPPDEVDEGSPVLGLLVERLVEQDHLGEQENGEWEGD